MNEMFCPWPQFTYSLITVYDFFPTDSYGALNSLASLRGLLTHWALLSLVFRCRLNQGSAGDHVVCIGLDQTHALSAAPCLANVARLEANQLSLLRDDHDLRIVFNRKYGHHLAGLRGCFHVDDALTAARLQTISRDRRLLAVALLRHGQHPLVVIGGN